jgi:hypothetical protein
MKRNSMGMQKQEKIIREQLLALLDGGNAHMSFAEVVARFPVKYGNIKPPNMNYTAWHLLEHMRIAQWDILEFIRNPAHVSPDWPDGYWPSQDKRTTGAQWEKTVKGFRADLKALQRLVKDPKIDLFGPIPHAKKYTIFREILVIADHNAYHIGEIATLRQILYIKPPGSW